MRLIGVGDNTVDRYVHLGVMFPGGNAVNVPVFARRFGHEASYLGWLGKDPHGRLVYGALLKEGVDCTHCRLVEGKNAYCEIRLVDGDRVFGDFDEGVRNQINLVQGDYAFIAEHDLTHTSIYSCIEPFIEKLAEASQRLSFDFSQDWDRDYLARMLPHTDYAILSSADAPEAEVLDLMEWALKQGPQLVLVTRGEAGSLASDGRKVHRQAIAEAGPVVDTLGAGDAFAARLLVEVLAGVDLPAALEMAAQSAAETCSYHGAFGHGVPLQHAGS